MDEKEVERRKQIEKYLDAGHGECFLRDERIAEIVKDTLLHFDGERYELHEWVIMPNHVHALMEMCEAWPLGTVLHSWKSFSAQQVAKMTRPRGHFWQVDYFDRFMRDEAHLQRAIAYIENNPVKAGLCAAPGDWPYGSARLK